MASSPTFFRTIDSVRCTPFNLDTAYCFRLNDASFNMFNTSSTTSITSFRTSAFDWRDDTLATALSRRVVCLLASSPLWQLIGTKADDVDSCDMILLFYWLIPSVIFVDHGRIRRHHYFGACFPIILVKINFGIRHFSEEFIFEKNICARWHATCWPLSR